MAETIELDGVLIFFIVFFLLLLLLGGCGGGYYYYQSNRPCDCESKCKCAEQFTDTSSRLNTYNGLYANNFLYTQPPGDTRAQEFGSSGQGTLGEFLPLQGIGAGIHMKNSTKDNRIIEGPFGGVIGGQKSLENKPMSTRWIGFNNYPETEESKWESNSYLISGFNERVCNPGQKCPDLPCADWWPTLHKDKDGFCVQASDSMVDCKSIPKNIDTCVGQGAEDLIKYKNQSQWRHVLRKR